MPGFFSRKLTEYSNHYVDWSRIGNLIQASSHRYSREEIVTRAKILVCTVSSAILTYNLNDKEKTNYSNFTAGFLAGLIGFTVSHTVVIWPLIKKRRQMSAECEKLSEAIIEKSERITFLPETSEKIIIAMEAIKKLSLSNDKNAKASQTWGRRKSLLSKLDECLEEKNFNPAFWRLDNATIFERLSSGENVQHFSLFSTPPYLSTRSKKHKSKAQHKPEYHTPNMRSVIS